MNEFIESIEIKGKKLPFQLLHEESLFHYWKETIFHNPSLIINNHKICYSGYFSAILGQDESALEYALSILIASLVSEDSIANKIKGNLSDYEMEDSILFFNTRNQSSSLQEIIDNAIRILDSSTLDFCEKLTVVQLLKYDHQLRRLLLIDACQRIENTGFIILNNIEDFIVDPDNKAEVDEFITELREIGELNNIHIMAVMNSRILNPYSRNYLEKEYTGQCDTIIDVNCVGDALNISIPFNKNGPIDSINLSFDKIGYLTDIQPPL